MRLPALALIGLIFFVFEARAQAPAPGCDAPAPVCQVSARVFAITSFDPVGSAVLIEPGLLVTNRHVVADNLRAEIYLPNGQKVGADVVPTSYPGDLILLKTDALPAPSDPLEVAEADIGTSLRVIGADVGRGAIRVYPEGPARLLPPADKPLARMHHTAASQPGNSGGAVVDADGRLVAIVASGGEGRNEAIPASELEKLRAMSGAEHVIRSGEIGDAVRKCTSAVDNANATREAMTPAQVGFIVERCLASGNRQLYDLAGQALGRRGETAEAIRLFEAALAEDPNALNSRLGLVITLHIAGQFEAEIPHVKHLLEVLPDDPQVLRFAIQAGTWGGDPELAARGLALMKQHHPRLAPVAERFLNQPPPTPRRQN